MRYSAFLNAEEDRGKRGPLSAVPNVLTDLPSRNSRQSDFARPLFSWSYELLFPQPLCFDNHLRCPIVFSALPPIPASTANSAMKTLLTPFLTYYCKLYVVAKKRNSLAIKQIRTLYEKLSGWVYLCNSAAPARPTGGLSIIIFRRICTILVHP